MAGSHNILWKMDKGSKFGCAKDDLSGDFISPSHHGIHTPSPVTGPHPNLISCV